MNRKFDMVIRGTIEIPEELNPMEMDEVEIAEYIGKNFGDFKYNGEAAFASMPELTEAELRRGIEEGFITLDSCGFSIGDVDVFSCNVYEYIDEKIGEGYIEDYDISTDETIELFNKVDECAKNYPLSDIIKYDSEEGQQREDELEAYEGLVNLGFFSKTPRDKLKPLKDVIKKFEDLMDGFGSLNVSSTCEDEVVSWTLTFYVDNALPVNEPAYQCTFTDFELTSYVDNALPVNEPAYQCTFTDFERKGAEMLKKLKEEGSSLYSFIIEDIIDTMESKSGLARERCKALCTILTHKINPDDGIDVKTIRRGLEEGGIVLEFNPNGSTARIGKRNIFCPELRYCGAEDIKLSYTSEEFAAFVYNAVASLSPEDQGYLNSYLRASGYFCNYTLYGDKDTKALDAFVGEISKVASKNGYTLSTYKKWSSSGHFNLLLPYEINFYFKKVGVEAAFRVGMTYAGVPLKNGYVYQQLLIGLDEVQNDNIGNVLYDDIAKIEADIRNIGDPDDKKKAKNETPLFTSC